MIKLPLRKHVGCDPMCDECCEWMERVLQLTKPATHEAIKAFWNVVESMLPQVAPNEPHQHSQELIRATCEEEVMHWDVMNLPEPELSVAIEPQKVLKFEPNAVHNHPDAEWKLR